MSVKGKLLYGIGLNDADYQVHGKRLKDNSIEWRCPYYIVWSNMLKRAYDIKTHKRQSTYCSITVCKEWHVFSVFKMWMETQDWENKALDKDIIIPFNTVYCPEACCFVETRINSLLNDAKKIRGDWPKGISLKPNNKFKVRCNKNGITKTLGSYNFEDFNIAVKDYCNFKADYIKEEAEKQTDLRVKQGLLLHSEIERNNFSRIINEYKHKINNKIKG